MCCCIRTQGGAWVLLGTAKATLPSYRLQVPFRPSTRFPFHLHMHSEQQRLFSMASPYDKYGNVDSKADYVGQPPGGDGPNADVSPSAKIDEYRGDHQSYAMGGGSKGTDIQGPDQGEDHTRQPPPEFSHYQPDFFVKSDGEVISHDPHLNSDGKLLGTSAAWRLRLRLDWSR